MSHPEPNWEQMAGHWFLKRLLRQLVEKFHDQIYLQRQIKKEPLYRVMSWWLKFSKDETLDIMAALAKTFPGIKWSNQGLWISSVYLDPKNELLHHEESEELHEHAHGEAHHEHGDDPEHGGKHDHVHSHEDHVHEGGEDHEDGGEGK